MVSTSYLLAICALAVQTVSAFSLGFHIKPVVFHKIVSITAPRDGLPETPEWDAKVDWTISKSMGFKKGSEFTLHMPFVSRLELHKELELRKDSRVYARCKPFSGGSVVAYSELQCVCTKEVEKIVSVSGTVDFFFAFNAGFAFDAVSLAAAHVWKVGENVVHWFCNGVKLIHRVHFSAGASFTFDGSIKFGAFYLRKHVFLGFNEHYLLGPTCGSTMSGYFEIHNPVAACGLECKSVKAYVTSRINAFCFPLFASKVSVEIQECTSKYVRVYLKNIPAGRRPYMNINALVPGRTLDASVKYSYDFKCGGHNLKKSHDAHWKVYGHGKENYHTDVTITTVSNCAATSTAVATKTGDRTQTVVVTVPCGQQTEYPDPESGSDSDSDDDY